MGKQHIKFHFVKLKGNENINKTLLKTILNNTLQPSYSTFSTWYHLVVHLFTIVAKCGHYCFFNYIWTMYWSSV